MKVFLFWCPVQGIFNNFLWLISLRVCYKWQNFQITISEGNTHTEHLRWHTHLSVLLKVGPHARPITSSHQDMVGEVVDARQWAGELASTRLVVVPYIGHNVVKLQYFTPFVLLSEACVEGDFGTVDGWAISTRSRPLWTRWAWLARLSRGPFRTWRTWRTRKFRAPSITLFAPAFWEVWGLRGDGCQLSLWGGESVTHHLAAPEHLVMRAPSSRPSPLGGVDQ